LGTERAIPPFHRAVPANYGQVAARWHHQHAVRNRWCQSQLHEHSPRRLHAGRSLNPSLRSLIIGRRVTRYGRIACIRCHSHQRRCTSSASVHRRV